MAAGFAVNTAAGTPDRLDMHASIAVIGCGAMGEGIAQVAAVAGHTVLLFDARPDAAAAAAGNIAKRLLSLAAKGRMGEVDAAEAAARIKPVATLAEVAGVALAVEAIVEDLEIKRTLFAQLEDIVGPQCILASNTSSISITALAARLRLPGRLAGMHFFNPVPLMALVEVVSGLGTDSAVLDAIHALALAWGKTPVMTRSTPGFIVNRLARPYYGEALRLLLEQAGDPGAIDAVMREAGGFRMGPFELMDLIGHDVNFAVTSSIFRAYFNDPRYTPSVIQQELVDAGFLGRKTGRGFFRYDKEGAAAAVAAALPDAGTTADAGVAGQAVEVPAVARGAGVLAETLASRLQGTASITADRSQDIPAGCLLLVDTAALYLTDGRSATQRACDTGVSNLVLLDLALDFAAAKRVALCAAEQCSAAAYDAVERLFLDAGIAVTRLADVPGMAVMRTVAMLVNEAADAVNQGVCTAQAADIAMCKGVNYPRGPLAWSDAIGAKQVVDVLANLAAAYGEDRYRVSPLLRRKAWCGSRFFE